MKSKNQQRRLKKKQQKLNDQKEHNNTNMALPEVPEEPKSAVTMLARKYDWIGEDHPLYEMYQQVTSHFKRPHTPETDDHHREEEEAQADQNMDEAVPPPSRKQQRQQNKPLLSELKKSTSRPELIEWFDADAPFPEFLVHMKTLPNAVPVPANWRQRNEIPQFNGKPNYDLPLNIKSTGIVELRTEANGRIDLDYETMHAAFFSATGRAQAEPTDLLPYGQVADLHYKARAFKPKTRTQSLQPPKELSERLRKALGLRPGDVVPWASAVEKLGPAPGYTKDEAITLWGDIDS